MELDHCSAPIVSGPETPGTATIRVLIVDDHDVVCAGLERVVNAQPDMHACGTASSGELGIQAAIQLRPAVAVLDMNMTGISGLDATRAIRRDVPECEVILFTGIETDELMRQAFACGAKSFILKTDVQIHLFHAIRALAQHKPYFTSKVSDVVFARLLRPVRGHAEDTGRLTSYELELVRRLALGDSNRDVAARLGVNLRTAEGQRAAVMKKMNFGSLPDLVRYAIRNSIVEVED